MDNLFCDLSRLKYLGEGAIIGKCVRIRRPESCVIGDHVIIDDFVYVGCALEIGSYSHVAANVNMSGGGQRLKIGDYVGIASGCSFHVASSDYMSASFELPTIPEQYRYGGLSEEIVLEDHVLLGAHTVVLPGVHLPEGFASAAHTVIRKRSFQPWTLYGGYDCRRMFKRNHRRLNDVVRQFEMEMLHKKGK